MGRKRLHIIEDKALAELLSSRDQRAWHPPYNDWVRILRGYLRMTQTELAQRAGILQSHVVKIESGKGDIQINTLRKVFDALSCHLLIEPLPQKPLSEILRGRARTVALKRIKQSMGTMALEDQAPEGELFKQLLEKKTDEILSDRREKLWNKSDE
jgi:predicted DNA-binding mobile mystery protein A